MRDVALPQPFLRISALVFATMVCRPAALAQNVLLAEDHGAMSEVVAAAKDQPCVLRDGKVRQITTKGYRLQEVPEYLPVFVTMTDIYAHSHFDDYGGGPVNTNFTFAAKLRTSYPLKDVFMVLSMESDVAGKSIFLSEVGDLDPNTSRPVELFFPLKSQLGPGKYEVHLFSEGAEVFQSQIPFWVRSNALNKMVAKRIEGVDKAAPKFLIGPEPIYPKSLRDANITGKAVVTVRIAVNGEPLDPVLKSATDPEFGKAALLALQDWRFLPRVKDGHPVETKVDVPFIFSPPKPSPAG